MSPAPTSAPAVATHERARHVLPTRLGVRTTERNAGSRLETVSFAPGVQRVGPLAVEVSLESRGASAELVARVRNVSDAEVQLESIVVGLRWAVPEAATLRFLRNGWQSWSQTGPADLDPGGDPPFPSGPWLRGLHHAVGTPPPDRSGWHESHVLTLVGSGGDGPACLVGVAEQGHSFGIVYARRESDAVALEAELRLDVALRPGEARDLEPVCVALGDDATALLERFAADWGRSRDARTWRPFVAGWCSWYWAFHEVGEEDVRRNLEALAAARDELPVEIVQIDDGYQRAVGDWLETSARFPRGIAPLAAEIREAGFVPGLWTAPFCAVGESAFFGKHSDWLLRDADGAPHRAFLHPAWAADAAVYALDPSRDEVCRHLESVFRELVEMGFLYLKLDFLYAAAVEARAHDAYLSRAQRLRRGLQAVRSGAGEEVFLLGCGCPLGAAVGVVDGMRIGPDVAPAWAPDPATLVPGIEETQPATRSAVRSALSRAWMHRRLWLNDPDCLLARSADTSLTEDERGTLAAAIAITGGMAFLSDDVPALTAADRALARSALEGARDVDGSGIPGSAELPDPLGAEIAERALAADAEGVRVALFNASDLPAERRPASDLPAVALPPHASRLLRLPASFRLAVFCDFDGTFSVQDVGATLARRHAGERRPEIWARYERGEISAWEYNLIVLDGLAISYDSLEAFLHTVDLDMGARELLAFCAERELPFRVLSDGFDWNLNRLQVIHDVRFAYSANHLRYEHGRWRISAGHPNPACGCGTGTCKRGILERFRAAHPDTQLVHIGNGRVSDTCGALAADLVFAKDSLAPELERRGVPFEPFETLRDVIPPLARRLA
jgi:alpha-galactosidase